MPRIKRWFPVSHEINRDPDLWDLRAEHGEKTLAAWLEILSISDRNEGEVPGDIDSISTAVAWSIRCRSTKVRLMIDSFVTKGWLQIDDGLKVANYAKYHISRDANRIPRGKPDVSLPSYPSDPSEPNLKEKRKSGAGFESWSAEDKWLVSGFDEFWQLYPRKRKKGDAEKAWKTLKPTVDLTAVILRAVTYWSVSQEWQKDNGQFIPYPASWLRARGWEDETTATVIEPAKPKSWILKKGDKPMTAEEKLTVRHMLSGLVKSVA